MPCPKRRDWPELIGQPLLFRQYIKRWWEDETNCWTRKPWKAV